MFSIIVATSNNNVIGKDNKLLWYLPNDLKRFKEITTDHKIIMGRKTFESLPKVLPNRYHIVLTKNQSFTFNNENVEIINSLNKLLENYSHSKEEVFIIGGGEIYKLFLPYVSKVYLTKVKATFEGDTFFPELNTSMWEKTYSTTVPKDSENTYDSEFIIYERKNLSDGLYGSKN